MNLWVFEGKGRCSGSIAYVRGETELAARARLLREDACEFFDIKSSAPFGVIMPSVPCTSGEQE